MSLVTAQKETPARGGRRAGDAIFGGVRWPYYQAGLTIVKRSAKSAQEAEWLV